MAVQVILLISITFQLIAAVWALRLTRLTGPQRAWLLIAMAVVFMAARRAVTLYAAFHGHHNDLPGILAEVIALGTSVLMVFGIAAVEPLLRSLQHAQDELEKRVAERTTELTQANAKLQAEITERGQIAEALQTSEARYRAIVEDQTDLICRYLPDGTLTFVNGAYCRMHGKTAEEMIGRDFLEFVPEEDHAHIKRVLARLSVDNPVLVVEHHQMTPPQGENWRQWTRRATFDEQGQIVEIQAVGRDITRQRLMEEAVREREASLRRIVENLPVMVDALDENGVTVMWNRECERVTGYSAEEIVGNPDGMSLLYPDPDYLKEMRGLYDQLGGDYRDWEVTLTAKDGTARIIAWSNVSKRYPIPGWQMWAIGFDITRRKQIEKALHEAHEALERRIADRTAALRLANEALQQEITQRERADLSLRTSQTMLRMTIDALADNVHVIDRDMRIILHNEAFRQMNQDLGLETRAIGRTPFELFPFLGEGVRAEYQRVFDTGQNLVTEESTTVGSLAIHTETRKIPVFDGDQVTHVVTVIRDITERERTAQALQRSEQDYRGLFESAHDAIIVMDPADQTVLDVNQRACEIYGFTRQEFLGLSLERIAQDVATTQQHIAATLAKGTDLHFETAQYRRDGSLMDLEINASVVNFQGKRAILSINRDVTERKQVEAALRESQRRYHMAAEAGQVGVWDWDLVTGALYMDPVVETMLGYEAGEMPRRPSAWGEIVYRDDIPQIQQALDNHLAGQTPYFEVEHRMLHKDGSIHWALARGTVMRDAEGRPYRLMGTDMDITARKLAEQEILELAIEKERSEILAAFVQDVSHEFANPISVIKNSVYLALNTADTDRRSRHLEVVNGQIFHVEKLVEGLLTMSRLDSGFPFRCEPVQVGDVLRAVYENLENAAARKNHSLVLDWADDLPPVMGDQKHLHLALRHLVDNAIQYTPPGGTITVRGATRGDQMVIDVSDTGIGIAPDHLDAIFQRFFRVERARTERGAGLGLPIARAIIERHGGTIEVESTPGAGSTFRVFLPISGC